MIVATSFIMCRRASVPALLTTIHELLAPGGRLVIFEHNPLNPVTRRAVAACPFDDNAVLLWPWEVKNLLRGVNLVEIDLDFIVFFPRALSPMRPLEPKLSWLPMGAQVVVGAAGRSRLPRADDPPLGVARAYGRVLGALAKIDPNDDPLADPLTPWPLIALAIALGVSLHSFVHWKIQPMQDLGHHLALAAVSADRGRRDRCFHRPLRADGSPRGELAPLFRRRVRRSASSV